MRLTFEKNGAKWRLSGTGANCFGEFTLKGSFDPRNGELKAKKAYRAQAPVRQRASSREKTKVDYAVLEHGGDATGYREDMRRFKDLLDAQKLTPFPFTQFEHGEQLTLDWVYKTGLREPVVIKNKRGLGLFVPERGVFPATWSWLRGCSLRICFPVMFLLPRLAGGSKEMSLSDVTNVLSAS